MACRNSVAIFLLVRIDCTLRRLLFDQHMSTRIGYALASMVQDVPWIGAATVLVLNWRLGQSTALPHVVYCYAAALMVLQLARIAS